MYYEEYSPRVDYAVTRRCTAATAHTGSQLQSVAGRRHSDTMALHTATGLGDFILLDKINMEAFTHNLKIRCVATPSSAPPPAHLSSISWIACWAGLPSLSEGAASLGAVFKL